MNGSSASLGHDAGECIGDDELLRYVGGALNEARMAVVRAHVDGCDDCRQLLAIVGREAAGAAPPPPPEPSVSFAAGSVIEGRFLVEGEIGRGGMGVVYAAKELSAGSPVALKVMADAITADVDAVPRFLRESRVAQTLKSPHVVKVLEVGRLATGAPYMVMERLRGTNLAELFRDRGLLDVRQAVTYIAEACDALGEAHALSVVHRDVKLENLFLTTDGPSPMVKVLDFGLATRGTAIVDASLTRTHSIMGTPRYMSPEQVGSARDVDARSDVWALGVCLYFLVTGRYPFDAPHFGALCIKIATANPAKPSTWRHDLPSAVEDVIVRCLERDPARRYANASELGRALNSSLGTQPLIAVADAVAVAAEIRSPEYVASDSRPQAGDVLAGKYRVERVLGVGGMAMVFAVTHLQLGELYALKCLLPDLAREPDTVARFMREAQAAARMKSEHIARVSDVGKLPDGPPFLVMEHLVGQDLAQRLRASGALPISEAVDIVLQACAAIDEAHSLGIVHRDLKPSNLFLTKRPDGSVLVKVLDFGISKITAGIADPSLTATQEVIGSPAYMSPEQIRSSRNVDGRTDIWSLGVILHQLLTNTLPFEGNTAGALLAAASADVPRSARVLRPEIGDQLDAMVRCCLEKNPDHRFQTVGELALALEPFGSGLNASLVRRIARGGPVSSSRGSSARLLPAVDPSSRSLVPPPERSYRGAVFAAIAASALGLALLLRPKSTPAPAPAVTAPVAAPASATSAPSAASVATPEPPAAPSASVVAAAPASARPRGPKRRPAAQPSSTTSAPLDPTSTSH